MQPTQRYTLTIGSDTFTLKCDIGAWATVEKHTGARLIPQGEDDTEAGFALTLDNYITLLWACIRSDAASRDEAPPISLLRFPTLIETQEQAAKAFALAGEIVRDYMQGWPPLGKANRAARRAAKQGKPKKRKPRSGASTNGAQSTSGSQS